MALPRLISTRMNRTMTNTQDCLRVHSTTSQTSGFLRLPLQLPPELLFLHRAPLLTNQMTGRTTDPQGDTTCPNIILQLGLVFYQRYFPPPYCVASCQSSSVTMPRCGIAFPFPVLGTSYPFLSLFLEQLPPHPHELHLQTPRSFSITDVVNFTF